MSAYGPRGELSLKRIVRTRKEGTVREGDRQWKGGWKGSRVPGESAGEKPVLEKVHQLQKLVTS